MVGKFVLVIAVLVTLGGVFGPCPVQGGLDSENDAASSQLKNPYDVAAVEPDEDENSCPFIYDKYSVELPVGTFSFSPAEYGFSHGYYCSFSLEGTHIRFPPNNCSCPVAHYCNDRWGAIWPLEKTPEFQVNVGRCQIYSWAVFLPLVVALLLSFCIISFCSKQRRRKAERVIVIRSDGTSDEHYVSLN